MLHQPPSGVIIELKQSRTIADGDLVIVYERIDAMKSYFVDAQKTYHGRFGLFPVQVGHSLLTSLLHGPLAGCNFTFLASYTSVSLTFP